MSPTAEADYQAVKKRLKAEAFQQKGPSFGNQGSTTSQWARENVSGWLTSMNPEVAVVMFGSNDVWKLEVDEYEKSLRTVVMSCLTNGTVVLLTTAPPQSVRLQKCQEYAAVVRRLARELQVPLIDYAEEVRKRRPFDWDGASADFKSVPGDTYNVPTLISRDGVHPSNPQRYLNDFSEEALNTNGYGLRNYLTMTAYAELIREVLGATSKP